MIPKIFVNCKVFNNECKRTKDIQNKFAEFLKPKEIKFGDDIDKIKISHEELFQELETYCEGCNEFSPIE